MGRKCNSDFKDTKHYVPEKKDICSILDSIIALPYQTSIAEVAEGQHR
jgi:hypothetical protein